MKGRTITHLLKINKNYTMTPKNNAGFGTIIGSLLCIFAILIFQPESGGPGFFLCCLTLSGGIIAYD